VIDDKAKSNWIKYVLMKKLSNQMESYDDMKDKEKLESNSLIDKKAYSELYCNLKIKYGAKLENLWLDEATDPKKFIYEDIAIATYLILLWKREREDNHSDKLQSFVDIGCGNGLLVYILTQEGYYGYGIDLRKRQIWSKYEPRVDLREHCWKPYDKFENIDWIIGNHSDELSPWVPVIAATNSPNCNYFLLPCCAFEFSGSKYQRIDNSKSVYVSFIEYTREISDTCGYATLIDRLKIPSTKRICLVGKNRSLSAEEFTAKCTDIENFVRATNDKKQFIAREKVQTIKNGTRIDKDLQDKIVRLIIDEIVSEEKFHNDFDDGKWNCGKEIPISDAIKLIHQDDLKQLKSECGGLQTLLKNNLIFEVHSGKIKFKRLKRLRDLSTSDKNKISLKSRPCLFHLYHKQGCYLPDEDCCFKHTQ
jgi:tRNASer (uridine44-2'-O)-methyltransferase